MSAARFKIVTILCVLLANIFIITEVAANSNFVCSIVNGQEDCGYVLSEPDEANLVVIGTREVEKQPEESVEKEVAVADVKAVKTVPVQPVAQSPVQTQPVNQQPVQTQPAAIPPTPEPQPAPQPKPQPVQQYVYTGTQSYSAKPMNYLYNGGGAFQAPDASTNALLGALGYNANTLWSAGIKIVGYPGLVPKNCAAGSATAISGMAVKPVAYARCPDGREVIPANYKTTGKCTVHYQSNAGNSIAILAHEISHCLHFIYGEYLVFDTEYKSARSMTGAAQTQVREVMADDFMICRHGVDTGWGAGSYYNRYGVSYPSAQLCSTLNGIFNKYFAV